MNNNSTIIEMICGAVAAEDTGRASAIARERYPFVYTPTVSRTCTPFQAMRVFLRDGFVDRYSGTRLVFPGVLRLLSRVLPAEFPSHPNGKMTETHMAFWELLPSIDHVVPIARGGPDIEENMVTTSMLQNSAKSNWTLEELGWTFHPPGKLHDWDGLTDWFIRYVALHCEHLADPYMARWHGAATRTTKVASQGAVFHEKP